MPVPDLSERGDAAWNKATAALSDLDELVRDYAGGDYSDPAEVALAEDIAAALAAGLESMRAAIKLRMGGGSRHRHYGRAA